MIVFDNGQSVKHLIPKDKRVKYHQGEADGPAAAFQSALELAKGEICLGFGDDDRLPPNALEIVDREIGDYEWLVGYTSFDNEHGEHQFQLGEPVDEARLTREYYLGGAVFFRRSLTDRVGGFNHDFCGAADYELYLRFARNAESKFVPETLYRYTDWHGTDSHVRPGNQLAQSGRIS